MLLLLLFASLEDYCFFSLVSRSENSCESRRRFLWFTTTVFHFCEKEGKQGLCLLFCETLLPKDFIQNLLKSRESIFTLLKTFRPNLRRPNWKIKFWSGSFFFLSPLLGVVFLNGKEDSKRQIQKHCPKVRVAGLEQDYWKLVIRCRAERSTSVLFFHSVTNY